MRKEDFDIICCRKSRRGKQPTSSESLCHETRSKHRFYVHWYIGERGAMWKTADFKQD